MLDVRTALVSGGIVPAGPEEEPETVRIILCQRRRRRDRPDVAWRWTGAGRGLRRRIGERADQLGGTVRKADTSRVDAPGVRIGIAAVGRQTPHRASPHRTGPAAARAYRGAITDHAPGIDRIHPVIQVVINGDGIRHEGTVLACGKGTDRAVPHVRVGRDTG